MSPRLIRIALALTALVLLTSACDVTVRIGTQLEKDGSGRFSLGVVIDKELREQLAEGHESTTDSLASLESLFSRLEGNGWDVSTTQPNGGVAYNASRAFKNSADFDALIGEVGTAQEGSTVTDLGGIALAVDHTVDRSFFKTESTFSGRIDTSGGSTLSDQTKDLIDALGQYVHFEVSADMPGAITDQKGGGSISEGTIVWRPRLGSALDFSSAASGFNTGALLVVMIPALLIAAIAGAMLLKRHPVRLPVVFEPAEGALAGEVATGPAPAFLAFQPDAAPVITLDMPVDADEPV